MAFLLGLTAPFRTDPSPDDAVYRPAPEVGAVTRYPDAVHLVTPDGVLYIIPADRSECVRAALPSADFADCVAEG